MIKRCVFVLGLTVLLFVANDISRSGIGIPAGAEIPAVRPPVAPVRLPTIGGEVIARLVRGNPKRKEVALTFDDGPHPGRTEKLLEILRREQVRATFFVVGKMVDKHPELVRQIAAEGHEVANHTYDHLRLASVPPALIEPQIREGARAIERAIGVEPNLFRPPGGEYDPDVIRVAKRLRSVMILWTDDPGDFAMPGSAVIEKRTLRGISNGSIVLLHDGILQTYDILPNLIQRLKQQGYRFVTISEMLRDPGAIRNGGPRVPLPKLVKTPVLVRP